MTRRWTTPIRRITVWALPSAGLLLGGCEREVPEPPAWVEPAVRSKAEERDAELRDELHRRVARYRGSSRTIFSQVYRESDYRPFWVSTKELTESGHALWMELSRADLHGLRLSDYRLVEIAHLWRSAYPPDGASRLERASELELVLSEAFLTFVDHRVRGRLDPQEFHEGWSIADDVIDGAHLLSSVGAEGDVRDVLAGLRDSSGVERRLEKGLLDYRTIERRGGWPKIDGARGQLLELGAEGDAVPALRRRLAITGDLRGRVDDPRFDAELEDAVKRFQARHGLAADGRVGEDTRRALNVPAEERVRQLVVNLERRRWLPSKLADSFILVNIPEFRLTAFRNGKPVLDMPVVVGTPSQATPVFSDELEYLVFRPYWNVPSSIAVNELLVQQRDDPTYLETRNYELVDAGGDVLPWSTATLTAEGLKSHRIRIRREPGPFNDLGQVKFMMPNEYHIYLHDTPSQRLFERDRRAFSHGCIRVSQPRDLAKFVLRGQWGAEDVDRALDGERDRVVRLNAKVPVHVVYFTAWVEPNGEVHFREDIYQHDQRLGRWLMDRNSSDVEERELVELLWHDIPRP